MFFETKLKAMGGFFSYKVLLKGQITEQIAKRLIDKAHKIVTEIEERYSEFNSNSLLCEINRNAGIKANKISFDDYILFEQAIEYSKKTNGIFDIAFRSPRYSYKEIQLDKDFIYLSHKDMKISLGGIGKGYAVDKAYSFLQKEGLRNFIVNGNGDIRVNSADFSLRPWKIGIKNPFSPEKSIGFIPIQKGAIASSGNYIQSEHINCIEESLQGVTVIAKTAIEADVFGTTLFRLGLEDAKKHITQHKLNAILIDRSGKVHNEMNRELFK